MQLSSNFYAQVSLIGGVAASAFSFSSSPLVVPNYQHKQSMSIPSEHFRAHLLLLHGIRGHLQSHQILGQKYFGPQKERVLRWADFEGPGL